jgi:hypothetical protein
MLIPAFPGEGFERAVKQVPGRASDLGAFSGPVARAHDEMALNFGGKAASDGAIVVEVGRTVKEHHRALQ